MIVPCDAPRASRLRAYAQVGSPFLQGVWAIEETRAILELPDGERPRARLAPEPIAELREALDSMHQRGLVHGAVDLEHVTLGMGRAVLWIPERPAAGDAAADLRALELLRDPG